MQLHHTKVGIGTFPDGRPYNPRGHTGDTTDLQAQIAIDGQRTPLSVTQPNTQGIHIVTRGHRTKAAVDALRAHAKAQVARLAKLLAEEDDIDESLAIQNTLTQAQEDAQRYSSYNVIVTDIAPDDTQAILHDMDAGIIQKAVDPVSLGETMHYRMEQLGWTFRNCVSSLGLDEAKARACLRAADSAITAPSVQAALRSGQMSLSMFMKKIDTLDSATQARVMRAAEQRAQTNKNAHGVVNARILNNVLESMAEEARPDVTPDSDVLPLLAQARECVQKALSLQTVWSPATTQSAAWQLEELSILIAQVTEQELPS